MQRLRKVCQVGADYADSPYCHPHLHRSLLDHRHEEWFSFCGCIRQLDFTGIDSFL